MAFSTSIVLLITDACYKVGITPHSPNFFSKNAAVGNSLPAIFGHTKRQEAMSIPALTNPYLLKYVDTLESRFPTAEYYKEEASDSGRGEGEKILISVCEDGGILEEEEFLYNSQDDLQTDLVNLDSYLLFS